MSAALKRLVLLAALSWLAAGSAAAQTTVSISNASVTEGDSGTANLIFTVSLAASPASDVTLSYAAAQTGTGATHAVSGVDYQATSGNLTFTSAGPTSQTVTVLVNGDASVERNETLAVNLSNLSGPAVFLDSQGTGTITDDDPPTISISDAAVTEGNSGTVGAVFTVSLSAASGTAVTVSYATANITATAGASADYIADSDTVSFAPGETTKNITIDVRGDNLVELNETFRVTLSSPSWGTLGDSEGIGTINDDDPPDVSVNGATVTEGDSSTVDAVFTVSLSAASGRTVTVNYRTVNGTATGGSDFTAISTTALTFNPGDTSKTVTVVVQGDTVNEPNETFTLDLVSATNATIVGPDGTGTITNDDPPAISINNQTVTETNGGTVTATFTVTLSNPDPTNTITVAYATANGSTFPATAGSQADYVAESGTVTFAPNDASEQITITVNGDTLYEYDETFVVNLTSPTNATIADSQGLGTITNDDNPPNLTIDDQTVIEGNSGTQNVVFTVSLSTASGRDTQVSWATADGTATAPADYVTGSNVLTINPGATTGTITVAVKGDTSSENNETYSVNLTSPVNATITDAAGLGTITDDDPPPTLSIGNVTQAEGNTGTTAFVFTVSLSAPAGRDVRVDWSTAGGSATAGADYSSVPATQITIPAGSSSQTVTVSVNGDVTHELDETFFVDLSNSVNATITDSQGLGTITNDDSLPQLSVNDRSVAEGNFGSTVMTFTVTLSPASSQTVTVNFATSDGTAVAGSDYVARTGVVSLSAGTTSQTFTVNVTGDTTPEGSETFNVTLGSPLNATISDGTGVGTITDDDGSPNITVNDVSVLEGNSGAVNAVFTVSLSATSGLQVTVAFATAADTATAGTDYTTTSGTLTFAPGTRTQSVSVPVTGDTLNELNETFFLNLSGATNATILDAQGKGTVADDDPQPGLTLADVSVVETDTGTPSAVVTATLSAASGRAVSAGWTTVAADAAADVDYTAGTGTLTLAPGSTTATITIPISPDLLDEPDETFLVQLSGVTNAVLGDGEAVVTIADDDPTPSLAVAPVSVTEGDTGTVGAVFTVSLSMPSGRTVSVNYATADGGGRAPGDYATTAGILTFAPGATTATVTVPAAGDLIDESDESFLFALNAPVNAVLGTGIATGTIVDDDDPPAISVGDVSLTEGDSGSTAAVFTVALTNGSAQTVTVAVQTQDGSASTGSDYTAVSRTLTFAPEQLSQTVSVPVLGDGMYEPQETFTLELDSPAHATIGDGTAQATISDNDPAPRLSIGDVTLSEGDSGVTTMSFTVTLSGSTAQPASAQWATVDFTAQGGSDYTAGSGTVTFPVGTFSRTVTVDVTGDTGFEQNERFFVELSAPVGAQVVQSEGWATVLNDDARPAISAADLAVTEGDSGTTTGAVTVSLSNTSIETVTVAYATANDTAVAGKDYTAVTGTLTFAPGVTTRTVSVPVSTNVIDEDDRSFLVLLSGPANATVLDGQSVVTIQDDDPLPTLSVADLQVTEGAEGTKQITFQVSLAGPTARTARAEYDLAPGTASAGDYLPSAGTVTLRPGVTTVSVKVEVVGDRIDEDDETFDLQLSSPTNASIADGIGVATILDDDAMPSISVGDTEAVEGDSGPTPMSFTVTLAGPTERQVTVSYQTGDGTAVSPDDYAGETGTVTFAAGDVSETIEVDVVGDLNRERVRDTFTLTLSSPVNATIADATATAVILDDDNPVADLDGDGRSDILLQDPLTGHYEYWRMDGARWLATVQPVPDRNASPSWRIACAADFDDDGRLDLFWYDYSIGDYEIWTASGQRTGISGAPPQATVLVPRATGDLDGNGHEDVLWVNASTGAVSVWLMEGLTRIGSATIPTAFADWPSWSLIGAADFTGDRNVDLVWQHSGGNLALWTMDGLVRGAVRSLIPAKLASPQRLVVAVADYDGDGQADLLWQNGTVLEVWYMAGVTRRGAATVVGPGIGAGLKVIGPR